MHGFVLFMVTSLVVIAAQAAPQQYSFDAKAIQSLELDHESGEVAIHATTAAEATVVATKREGGDKCVITVEQRGAQLFVETDDTSTLGHEDCTVDLEILVPATVVTDAAIGATKLTLDGLTGPLDLKVGAGTVEGTVAVSELDAKVGAGKVDLEWSRPIAKGYAEFKVGAGTVDLRYPQAMTVATDVTRGFGTYASQLRTDPSARYAVRAKLGFGTVNLGYASAKTTSK